MFQFAKVIFEKIGEVAGEIEMQNILVEGLRTVKDMVQYIDIQCVKM